MKSASYFLSSEIPNASPEKAFFHIIPAPFEKSVSYGYGTARGPQAIINAGDQLELWDGRSSPGAKGIHTTPFIKGKHTARFLENLEKQTARSLAFGSVPIILGGEHTISLGSVKAVYAKHGKKAGLVQIDAHADLRNELDGNPMSHACVIRRIHETTGWPIIQIAIRAECQEETEYRKENGITCYTGRQLYDENIRKIKIPDDFPEYVYLTIDVDGFDPSVIPATGTPVPGGLLWYQGLNIIESIAIQRKIIAFDVVELAPRKQLVHCDFTAAQLVYSVMGLIERTHG